MQKQCDQGKPACSRCVRCNIACTGSGQQRYKFIGQMSTGRSTRARQPVAPLSTVRGLPQSPSNETTTIAGAFISTLEVKDLRYDLSCYGAFIKDIPKRLGSNAALDASVNVLTSAFSSLYTRQQSLMTLSRYVNALKTLRHCLNDPSQACTANTLCAVYLLLICQVGTSAFMNATGIRLMSDTELDKTARRSSCKSWRRSCAFIEGCGISTLDERFRDQDPTYTMCAGGTR